MCVCVLGGCGGIEWSVGSTWSIRPSIILKERHRQLCQADLSTKTGHDCQKGKGGLAMQGGCLTRPRRAPPHMGERSQEPRSTDWCRTLQGWTGASGESSLNPQIRLQASSVLSPSRSSQWKSLCYEWDPPGRTGSESSLSSQDRAHRYVSCFDSPHQSQGFFPFCLG